jgi:hypothetical protein
VQDDVCNQHRMPLAEVPMVALWKNAAAVKLFIQELQTKNGGTVTCLPPSFLSPNPVTPSQGSCQYRHKDNHNKVDTLDFFGQPHSCSSPDKSVWYEECRDHKDQTEEVGCKF